MNFQQQVADRPAGRDFEVARLIVSQSNISKIKRGKGWS